MRLTATDDPTGGTVLIGVNGVGGLDTVLVDRLSEGGGRL